MLKIYVQDHGVWGCNIVAAASLEEAHRRMAEKGFMHYNPHYGLDVYEIEGFSFENLGDT